MSASNARRWIYITMFMCISMEAVLFHYLRCVRWPLLMSFVANVASLIAGLPLALISAGITDRLGIDSGFLVLFFWLLLPTILGVLLEIAVLWAAKPRDNPTRAKFLYVVISANVLTNIMLIGCIVFGHWKGA